MSVKLSCLLVDDENLALDILEEYIKKVDFLQLVGRCNTAIEANNVLSKIHVDLLFIDIQMPEISGIDFVRNLAKPPKVIFTTAFREYALEGFDLNATDYLLKPISFQRFMKSVNRLLPEVKNEIVTSVVESEKEELTEDFFYIKVGKRMVKIQVADILYIESLTSFVYLHTSTDKHVCYKKISEFEESLPASKFIRIHRSFLVSVAHIQAYSASHVEVDGKSLPIGRLFRNDVLAKMEKYSHK